MGGEIRTRQRWAAPNRRRVWMLNWWVTVMWHILHSVHNKLMHALHGNGTSRGGGAAATERRRQESNPFGGLVKGLMKELMEEIDGLRLANAVATGSHSVIRVRERKPLAKSPCLPAMQVRPRQS